MARRDGLGMSEFFQGLKSDYEFTKSDVVRRKRTGLAPMGASADWHIRFEYQYLHAMELARDVDRNDIVVGQGIDRVVANIVQSGFPVDPQTGNDEANQILSDKWLAWSQNKRLCHFGQTSDFSEIEKLVLRSVIVDGDMFVIPTDRGSLETIEGHRCRRPNGTQRNVVFGILKDEDGVPQEAWFTRENIQPMQQLNLVSEIKPYKIWDADGNLQLFHLVRRRRVSQTRGITQLAPIFTACGLHDDIQFAALVKQQVATCIAFLREKPLESQLPPGTMGETELRANPHSVRLLQNIFPGMEVTGNPGEKLLAFSPNVGGSDFLSHSRLILTFISINLDTPLHIMLLDPKDGNFSGQRGITDQARLKWREIQKWLISGLHRPTYEWKVREWLQENSKDGRRLRAARDAGAAMFSHIWHPPGWSYIEPLKDAQADALEVGSNLNSPRRVLGRKQLDWGRITTETVEDLGSFIRKAKKMAAEINAEFDDDQPVHWRELMASPLPQGISMAIQSAPDEPEPATEARKEAA